MSQLFIYWGHKLHVLGEPKLHNSALGAVLVWHAIVYVKEQFGRRREEGAVLRRPMNLPHYLQGTAHAAILPSGYARDELSVLHPFVFCRFQWCVCMQVNWFALEAKATAKGAVTIYASLFFYLFSNATGSMAVPSRGGLQWICNKKYS